MEKLNVKVAPSVLVAYIRQLDVIGQGAAMDALIQGRDQCIVIPVDLVEAIKSLVKDHASEPEMQAMEHKCGAMPCFPW